MSECQIRPAFLKGTVCAPPSKSAAHRALICAALTGADRFPDHAPSCDGPVFSITVSPISGSRDMDATLDVLQEMGARFTRSGSVVQFFGFERKPAGSPVSLHCRESGSTLRFLLPVAAALGLTAAFSGAGRLSERPMEPLTSLLREHGVRFSAPCMPFTISGQLSAGRFALPGNVSSQFISGLLFALPLLEGDSEITLTSPLQSAGYVDMTLHSLAQAGITIHKSENGWRVPGGQSYRSRSGAVEGDWSNAAFWLCAGAVNGEIKVTGLDPHSAQGDRSVLDILRAFGAKMTCTGSTAQTFSVSVSKSDLQGTAIDAGPVPDLIPVLAVCAAAAKGKTEIYNAARLRMKESDRIATVHAMLEAFGAQVTETADSLCIEGCGGVGRLSGGIADGANDHRIVMSAAVAALACGGPVTVSDYEAVTKSYPDFFLEYQRLGGVYSGVDLGKLL